jgi:DNA-binding transcriptional ArsR family regulator
MKRENTEHDEQLARFAKAMGHPTRIAILKFLASRSDCFFGEIHEVLPIAKATVSQHLTQLKNAGLIQGEIFPPKVKYCINPKNWELAKKMLDELMCSFCSCKSIRNC